MTGPRDMSAEWAAVWAAAYLAELDRVVRLSDEARDAAASYAAQVADEAVRALHRVRGGEP